MRKLLYAILLVNLTTAVPSWMRTTANQKGKPKFLITGSIMQTISYCGGAQPTQQILDSCNKLKGIPYGKLFLKSGKMNVERAPIIQRIVADVNGNFAVYLPAGNYCLVEEWKSTPFKLPLNDAKQTIDSICFRNLHNACDFKLVITNKSVHHVNFVFHRPCFYNQPCISYHGALRP